MNANDTQQREPIGLKDVTGKDILVGDVVEFYFCPNHGPSDKETSCAQRIVDVAAALDTPTPIKDHFVRTYYFWSLIGEMIGAGSGAFAHRFAKFSKVIGKLPEDAELVLNQMPYIFQPQGPARDKMLKTIRELPLVRLDEGK